MKSIDTIFYAVVHRLAKTKRTTGFDASKMFLASGGIYDSKKTPSDVDIVYFVPNYNELSFLVEEGFVPEHQPDRRRTFYKKTIDGREVNILATYNEEDLRSIKHRQNELLINSRFPLIAAAAIANKLNGDKTEAAYARALGAASDVDPYALLADWKQCLKLATERTKKMRKIIQASPKP